MLFRITNKARMTPIEVAYLLFSGTLAAAGFTMVGMAVHAYQQTERREMFHLSVGFALIVAGVLSTTITTHIQGFDQPQLLLSVQYAVMSLGFLFVIYSIVTE